MIYIVYDIIIIIGIAIIIYLLKNLENYKEFTVKYCYEHKKVAKLIKICLFSTVVILSLFLCLKYLKDIKNYILFKNSSEQNNDMFEEYDEKINQEYEYYNNVIKNINTEENYKNPYILEGFSYVDGEWNNGYVIQDEVGNQYVWIPCSNIGSEEVVKLDKINLDHIAFISKDACNDEEYEKFIISALENGGFYVSRYEIGKENNNPVSKQNVPIWYGVTRADATNILNNMYTNKEFRHELINGIAYDTMISWILKNNELENILRPIEDDIKSGNKMYNNIYDVMDNIMELTNESCYDTTVIRGFLKNEEYPKNNRYNIFIDGNKFSVNSLVAFRSMIYK